MTFPSTPLPGRLLHVTSGDSLKDALETAGLPGEKIAWREALARGPVHPEVASEAFWQIRARHIQETYPESALSYRSGVIPEFDRMQAFDQFDAYVLWFGQDYFCQVNQLALLSWLRQSMPPSYPIFLVSVDHYPGIPHLTCLGSLRPEQLATLLPASVQPEPADYDRADRVWRAYCSADPLIFNELSHESPSKNLPFLHRMIQQHRLLFPHIRNGLNQIERTLLQLVSAGVSHRRELTGRFLRQDGAYGFGDTQIAHFIKGIDSLLDNEPLRLTGEGIEILEEKAFFTHPETSSRYHGGALAGDFVWTGDALKPR